mmetsp:Transcript_45204/g.130956  ORF Transcript_45204/g.130956 Transcript_45204/m.130956 type:complete len:87 (-) Transcript_45204:19-279(-)
MAVLTAAALGPDSPARTSGLATLLHAGRPMEPTNAVTAMGIPWVAATVADSTSAATVESLRRQNSLPAARLACIQWVHLASPAQGP